jgi:hypothetical protein
LVIGLLFVPSLLISEGQASTYYLSTTGSDSESGTSTSPWKTFGFAIPKLRPGDTLILKNGAYNTNLSINCAAGAASGQPGSPVTIKAENERQALIQSDGLGGTLIIRNCSYWVIEGLRIQGADNTTTPNPYPSGNVVYMRNVSNITFRRNLLRFNNRWTNSHLVLLEPGSNSLFEENELYSFHRHGFAIATGDNNTFRRNYCNSRNAGPIGGYHGRGACFALYPATNTTLENNISESIAGVTETGHKFAEVNGSTLNNKFYGNVAIRGDTWVNARGNTLSRMPRDTFFRDHVAIDNIGKGSYSGIRAESAKNVRCDNCTFTGMNTYGIRAYESGITTSRGDGQPTFYSDNTLFINISGTGSSVSGQSDWQIDSSRYFGNGKDSSPELSDSRITNTARMTVDPKLSSCKVWIPDESPLKRAGKDLDRDGKPDDIGANVLYAYEKGVLQNGDGGTAVKRLWNPTTGAWLAAGAIVPGVNDIAGQSAFDVHKRLNVNVNGCSFPAEYSGTSTTVKTSTSGSTSSPSSPVNLIVTQ